jgi:hypothetical protein
MTNERTDFHNWYYIKIAGWNILRAAVCAEMHQIVCERANIAAFWLNFAFLRMTIAGENVLMDIRIRFSLNCCDFEKSSKIGIAA